MYDDIINNNRYITAESVSDFAPEELSGTLIGRVSDVYQLENPSEIGNMPTFPNHHFEQLTNNLYALNLNGLTGGYSYISELLRQNYFHYFEVDQAWSIV